MSERTFCDLCNKDITNVVSARLLLYPDPGPDSGQTEIDLCLAHAKKINQMLPKELRAKLPKRE
ncbi:hypothetical protein LCGC14_2771820 [marine sediment metagenome]|uniref:Uncharacterized protein n=1 Tax=marine sediment metagenome TaxID=412755 RepID=A0A0F8YVZ3_9ZZZZ